MKPVSRRRLEGCLSRHFIWEIELSNTLSISSNSPTSIQILLRKWLSLCEESVQLRVAEKEETKRFGVGLKWNNFVTSARTYAKPKFDTWLTHCKSLMPSGAIDFRECLLKSPFKQSIWINNLISMFVSQIAFEYKIQKINNIKGPTPPTKYLFQSNQIPHFIFINHRLVFPVLAIVNFCYSLLHPSSPIFWAFE